MTIEHKKTTKNGPTVIATKVVCNHAASLVLLTEQPCAKIVSCVFANEFQFALLCTAILALFLRVRVLAQIAHFFGTHAVDQMLVHFAVLVRLNLLILKIYITCI